MKSPVYSPRLCTSTSVNNCSLFTEIEGYNCISIYKLGDNTIHWEISRKFSKTKVKWLPIDQLFLIDKICLLRKIIEGHVPEYLISKLESFRFQHQYNTKCKTDFCLPKPGTNSLKRTFFYSTIKSWNIFAIEDIQRSLCVA